MLLYSERNEVAHRSTLRPSRVNRFKAACFNRALAGSNACRSLTNESVEGLVADVDEKSQLSLKLMWGRLSHE